MASNELNPLYRTLVGFDRIANLMDQAARLDAAPGYPPFNVEQTGEDAFTIELAVAGFGQDDLSIEFKQNSLIVTGQRKQPDAPRNFLHRGIATRQFRRVFALAEGVEVSGARLDNGLLEVTLERREPETVVRSIPITRG